MKSPAPEPEAASVREAQLVGIAAELFGRKGYEATALRDIAEAAGITKAALYYWFPDKNALFVRVISLRLEALLAKVQAAVDAESAPLERVRAFLLCAAAQIDADRIGWSASSNAFWSNLDPTVRASLVPQRDRFEKLLRQCVKEAIAAGEMRKVDAALATRMLLSMLNFLPRWHRPDGRLSARQVMTQYLDMALDGLRPDEAAPRTTARAR